MTEGLLITFVIIPACIGFVILTILIINKIINSKYRAFILQHSEAIKALGSINKNYRFKKVNSFNMEHSYDNEDFYNDISCEDYLTYQLVYIKGDVLDAIDDCEDNKEIFDEYKEEVKRKCVLNRYDTLDLPKNKRRLKRVEDRTFNNMVQLPVIDLNIRVKLYRTNINGAKLSSKTNVFNQEEIKNIIGRLSRKRGNYYMDSFIWDSLVRVERGKVSNRMRFAIYQRDGYRCRRCGSKKNLEIDHIVPIAKGGKSTMDNLQTLCHRCNVKKGTNTARY